MRCKTVLSIIAFVTAFAVSVAVTPQTVRQTSPSSYYSKRCSETARKITNLLERDIANGQARDRKMNRVLEQDASVGSPIYNLHYTAAVTAYTKESLAIDTADLPNEFKSAWREHMNAWQKHSDFLNENVGLDGRILRERGFYRTSDAHIREISETWYEVLRIARKHGAEIPAGAY
jgi:hypothetical protein